MRSKLVLAVLITFSTLPVFAQVAPAVKIGGLPLGIGGGLSDYSLDYGPGRRMIGVSAWADYSIFHGVGIEAEGTTIFADRPAVLPRMRQDTIKGGLIYKTGRTRCWEFALCRRVWLVWASLDFPSRNPFYTHDTFTMYAIGGGAEYKIWKTLYARVDYEYQWWPQVLQLS